MFCEQLKQLNSEKFCRQYKYEYCKVNVKLSNSQLNKFETAAKNHSVVALRMNIKMFNGYNLPHELLLQQDKKLN